MSCDHPLPTHIYAEGFDNGRATAEARAVVSSLSHAGVPAACITVQTLEQFQISHLATMSVTDLAVGNPSFVRLALQQLGVPMPEPCDYPACLSDTPRCRLCSQSFTSLAQLISSSAMCSKALSANFPMFSIAILPLCFLSNQQHKLKLLAESAYLVYCAAALTNVTQINNCAAESAALWIPIWREQLPATFAVLCAQVIDIVAEFRVYVVNGTIRAVCQARAIINLARHHHSDVSAQYGKKSCSPGVEALHMPSVADAVRVLSCSSESLAGCAVDFAVLKSGDTCLVEVNDGVFTGQYDGVSDDDFAAMYAQRP